jgi:hypothetical protein
MLIRRRLARSATCGPRPSATRARWAAILRMLAAMAMRPTNRLWAAMPRGVPVGELAPLRRHRFVSSDTVVALFRHAPAVDYARFRDDLDRVSSEDPTPRG